MRILTRRKLSLSALMLNNSLLSGCGQCNRFTNYVEMPPKRRKFESTFPAARIKKIMQLDDDVGRVASSVPVVISRAVEIFLHALLSRAAEHASSRSAKTLTVSHLKHCIQCEKQWDFLKELTSKIADLSAEQEEAEENYVPKRGRKRRTSPSPEKPPGVKKRPRKTTESRHKDEEDMSSQSDEDTPEPPPVRHKGQTSVGSRESGLAPTIYRLFPASQSQVSSTQQTEPPEPPLHEPPSDTGQNISSLAVGLQRVSSQDDNSDDDYD